MSKQQEQKEVKMNTRLFMETEAYRKAKEELSMLINLNNISFNSPNEDLRKSNLIEPKELEKRSEADTDILKRKKKAYKKNPNSQLRNEFIELIVNSKPRYNVSFSTN